MSLSALTSEELEVVRRIMAATFQYFDFDFHMRLGIFEADMHSLLKDWPDIDDSKDDSDACLAINNSLNDLLHGVGISDAEAIKLTGVDRSEIHRIYRKWVSARGWPSTGVR